MCWISKVELWLLNPSALANQYEFMSFQISRKALPPSNVWNLLKVLLLHTVLIQHSSRFKYPFKLCYSRKNRRLKILNFLWWQFYHMGISKRGGMRQLEMKWNFLSVTKKKPYWIPSGALFGPETCKAGTMLWWNCYLWTSFFIDFENKHGNSCSLF